MANEPTINTDQFLVNPAKSAMEQVVKRGDDFMPTLITEYQDGDTAVIMLAVDGHPFDALLASAKDIIHGPLASISLTTDTYMWQGKPEDFTPGPLHSRFEAGDPDVSEALQIIMAHRVDGEAVTIGVTLPYVWDRTLRTITWGEEMNDSISHEGRMVDLMRAILVASAVL